MKKCRFLTWFIVASFFIFGAVISTPTLAQTSIGGRLGLGAGGSGLTFQHFINKNSAAEALLTFNKKDIRVTALYEYHHHLPLRVKGVTAYAGFGGHAGRLHSQTLLDVLGGVVGLDIGKKTFFGVDAIAGLQYDLPMLPINISADIKPNYNFGSSHPKNFQFGGAFSVRWTFGKGGGGGKGKGGGKGSGSGIYSGKGSSGGGASGKKQGTLRGGSTKSTGSVNTKGTSPTNGKIRSSKGSTVKTGSSSSSQPQNGKIKPNGSSTTTTTANGKIKNKPTTGKTNTPKKKPKIRPKNTNAKDNNDEGEDKDKEDGTRSKESWGSGGGE